MSENLNYQFSGESSSLTKALDKAIDRWSKFFRVEKDAIQISARMGKEFIELEGKLKLLDASGKQYNITATQLAAKSSMLLGKVRAQVQAVNQEAAALKEATAAREAYNKASSIQAKIRRSQAAANARTDKREIEEATAAQREYNKVLDRQTNERSTRPQTLINAEKRKASEQEAARRAFEEAEKNQRILDNNRDKAERKQRAADNASRKAALEAEKQALREATAAQQAYNQAIATQSNVRAVARTNPRDGASNNMFLGPQAPQESIWTRFWNHFRSNQAQANAASQEFLITWEGLARIVAVQILHKGITALIMRIDQGLEDAKKLGIAIGEIQTIDFTGSSINNWFDTLKRTSDLWGSDIFDQAEAAYESLSSQVTRSTADTEYFLNIVNEFAAVTKTSASDAINLLTGAINAYGLELSDASRLSAQFFKIIDLGRVRAKEMANSGDLQVVAKQLGVKFEELGGAITVLTRQGTEFNKVNTELSLLMLKLIQPTDEMKALFKELGVESGEAAIQTYGFGQLLGILQEKTKGSSSEIGKLFSRINAIRGAIGLTGKGLQAYFADVEAIKNAEEGYVTAKEKVITNASKKLQIETNKINNYFTSLGVSAISSLDRITGGFDGLEESVKTLAKISFPLLTTAIVAATVAMSRFIWAGAVALVSTPAGALALAIGLITAYLVKAELTYKTLEQTGKEAYEELKRGSTELLLEETKRLDKLSIKTQDYYSKIGQTDALTSATMVTTWNKLQESRIEESEKASTVIKKHYEDLAAAHAKIIDGMEDKIRELTTAIDKSDKIAANAPLEAQNAIFEHQFDGIDDDFDKAIALIDKRMAELSDKVNNNPLTIEDAENNETYIDEFVKLLSKKYDYQLKAQDKAKKTAEKIRDAGLEDARRAGQRELDIRERIEKELAAGIRNGVPVNVKGLERAAAEAKRLSEELEDKARSDYAIALDKIDAEKAQLDIAGKLNEVLEFRLDLNKKAHDQLVKQRVDEEARLKIEKARQQSIEDARDVYNKTKASDIYKEDDAKVIAALRDEFASASKVLIDEARATGQVDLENKLKAEEARRLGIFDTQLQLRTEAARREQQTASANELENARKALKDLYEKYGTQALEGKAKLGAAIKAFQEFPKEQVPEFSRGAKLSPKQVEEAQWRLNQKANAFGVTTTKQLEQAYADLGNSVRELNKNDNTKPMLDFVKKYNLDAPLPDNLTEKELTKLNDFRVMIKDLVKYAESIDSGEVAAPNKAKELAKLADEALQRTSKSMTNIATAGQQIAVTISDLERAIGVAAGNFLSGRINPAAPLPAGGAFIPSGTDTVPAMLSPGEFVVNAAATKQFYSQLVAMNSSIRPRHFAEGGGVDVGGVNVNIHSAIGQDPQAIAKAVVGEINRGLRQKTIKFRR